MLGGDRQCVPGCSGFSSCVQQPGSEGCWWPPSHLKGMLEDQDADGPTRFLHGYNEVILDTYNQPWDTLYPRVVQAVIIQARCSAGERSRAYETRRQFCAEFTLGGRCVPVLEYDEERAEAPFAVLPGE